MKLKYVALAVVVVMALGLGWYGLAPIFTNVALNETLPEGMEQESAGTSAGAEVVGTVGHPATGTARIIEAEGKQYVRYEDFETLNGPDLFVYLAKDLNANEFVNLGRLRATEGNVNYEIPADVDPSEYRYVIVWCRAFSVLFNYADLNAVQ